MLTRTLRTSLLALLAVSLLAVPVQAAPPDPGGDGPASAELNATLAQVRAATARFHDVEVALAEGYEPASPCIPGMGFHYARGLAGATHAELDPLAPEMLVYAPQPSGELKLVAVEYAYVPGYQGPTQLFGREFDDTTQTLGFYSLHAWVWSPNPDGMFEAHNPRITC